jgi:hypothetical protein
MEFRDILSKVLHESLATGKGGFASIDQDGPIDDFPIDPYLLGDSTSPLARVSPIPQLKAKKALKTTYNRSRKRVKINVSDEEVENTLEPVSKKVDLGYAISSLSAEMARGRKAQQEVKTPQEKAIQLLESYGERLDTMAFIHGCNFFADDKMACIFIGITSEDRRDRWLEVNLQVEIKSKEEL